MRFLGLVTASASLAFAALACRSLGTEQDQRRADSLWEEMSGYTSWSSFAGHEGIEPGQSPHGAFVRTFVNGVGADDPSLPHGTIVVKENFSGEDVDTLQSLTVMQRVDGYDPDSADWFWARYVPDGELTHSGRVAMCADCHFDAGGDDFVFLND